MSSHSTISGQNTSPRFAVSLDGFSAGPSQSLENLLAGLDMPKLKLCVMCRDGQSKLSLHETIFFLHRKQDEDYKIHLTCHSWPPISLP